MKHVNRNSAPGEVLCQVTRAVNKHEGLAAARYPADDPVAGPEVMSEALLLSVEHPDDVVTVALGRLEDKPAFPTIHVWRIRDDDLRLERATNEPLLGFGQRPVRGRSAERRGLG